MQLYKEFFENVRDRKPSPLSPEAAQEPAKIAYGAEFSISENRIVTARDFPAVQEIFEMTSDELALDGTAGG